MVTVAYSRNKRMYILQVIISLITSRGVGVGVGVGKNRGVGVGVGGFVFRLHSPAELPIAPAAGVEPTTERDSKPQTIEAVTIPTGLPAALPEHERGQGNGKGAWRQRGFLRRKGTTIYDVTTSTVCIP